MSVPFLDLKAQNAEVRDPLQLAFERVMDSGWYIQGTELEQFEQEFAAYCGAKYCIGVGNGLDALQLILRALDIGPGDEVIVPANTFIATWLAVSSVGASPVPVEPDPATSNIDPERVRESLSPKTKAIIPVHLYGLPAEMEAINDLADQSNIAVIEDAAQAHGAIYRGRKAGSLGIAAGFSFYPGKNLGAIGDGGGITTSDPKLDNKLRLLRNYGSKNKYEHLVSGVNSRLDELQAAFLRVKLQHLDAWNTRRQSIAQRYLSELRDTHLDLPQVSDHSSPVWHLFVVRSSERDRLQKHLTEQGIQTMIHYPTVPHLQPAYAGLGLKTDKFPLAERLQDEILSLPIYPQMSDEQVTEVIAACQSFEIG